MHPLPNYARRIEYLESAGRQWVDSGIRGSMTLDFVADFTPLEMPAAYQSGKGSIFGAREDWNRNAYQLTTYANNRQNLSGHFLCAANYGWNDSRTPYAGMVAGRRCTIRKDGLVFTRADGTTYTLPNQSFDTPHTILVFASYNTAYVTELCKMRLYSLQFRLSGAPVRSFVPCRVGSVGYLWDEVTGAFFGNSGTGNFVLGTDIAGGGYHGLPTPLHPLGGCANE